MQDYAATAAYFEERAKKARHPAERARLTEVAASYRAKAADAQSVSSNKTRHHARMSDMGSKYLPPVDG
jgi:hypothetical protein